MLEALFKPFGGLDRFLLEYAGQRALLLPGFLTAPAPLEELAFELARVLEADVAEVETPAAGRGFLALQLEGTSACRLAAEEPPIMLQPGDALYAPGGPAAVWMDSAGRRAHFEIRQPTGADLLRWVIGEVEAIAPFSAELPRFAGPAVQYAHLRTLRQSLITGLRTPGLLPQFLRHLDESAEAFSSSAIPPPKPGWIAPATRRRLKVQRAAGAGTLMVAHGGRQHLFPQRAAPLLHYLIDRAPVRVAAFEEAFAGEFPANELVEFLDGVTARGLFAIGAGSAQ